MQKTVTMANKTINKGWKTKSMSVSVVTLARTESSTNRYVEQKTLGIMNSYQGKSTSISVNPDSSKIQVFYQNFQNVIHTYCLVCISLQNSLCIKDHNTSNWNALRFI